MHGELLQKVLDPQEGAAGTLKVSPSRTKAWVTWGPATRDWRPKWGTLGGLSPKLRGPCSLQVASGLR